MPPKEGAPTPDQSSPADCSWSLQPVSWPLAVTAASFRGCADSSCLCCRMQVALLEGEASAAASQARQAQDQLAAHKREIAAQQEALQAEREAHKAETGQLQQRLQEAVDLQEQQREAHSAALAELRGRHAGELEAQAGRLTSQHQALLDRHSTQLREAHAQELEGAQAAAVRLEQLLGAEKQKSLNLKVGG